MVNDKIPVAMAPLAQLEADNIATYIMREKFQHDVDRVTTPA